MSTDTFMNILKLIMLLRPHSFLCHATLINFSVGACSHVHYVVNTFVKLTYLYILESLWYKEPEYTFFYLS